MDKWIKDIYTGWCSYDTPTKYMKKGIGHWNLIIEHHLYNHIFANQTILTYATIPEVAKIREGNGTVDWRYIFAMG